MNITEAVRGAWRRVAGVSSAASPQGIEKKRRTSGLPSIFNSYGPLTEAMPKPTPYNLRRFSELPIARRAINCIKDRIAGMRWRVQPRQGYALDAIPNGAERVRILTSNSQEVWRSGETYHSAGHSAGKGLGGAAVQADVRVVLEIQDINPSVPSTTVQVDIGIALPTGWGVEVRAHDYGWGPSNGRNVLGRFTTQAFSLPRLARTQNYFLRAYDNSSPTKYSRYSAALHVDYPL